MTRAQFKLTLIWLFLLTLAAGRMIAQSTNDELFEKKLRPVLAANCYGCHFSKLKPPNGRWANIRSSVARTRAEIRADMMAVEREAEGLPDELLKGGAQ